MVRLPEATSRWPGCRDASPGAMAVVIRSRPRSRACLPGCRHRILTRRLYERYPTHHPVGDLCFFPGPAMGQVAIAQWPDRPRSCPRRPAPTPAASASGSRFANCGAVRHSAGQRAGRHPSPSAAQAARRAACGGAVRGARRAAERIVVSTDVLKLTFDTEGGSLVRTEFLKHRDMADRSKNFVLLDETRERRLRCAVRPHRRHCRRGVSDPQDADDSQRCT